MNPTIRVGRITVALSLVAFGLGLLLDNLGFYTGAVGLVAKLWPAMLIGFGLEYLIFTALGAREGQERRIRFDGGGAFLLTIIVLISLGITAFKGWNGPGGVRFSLPIGPQESVTDSRTIDLGSARELVADIGVGTMTLQPGADPGNVRVEATYSANGITVGGVEDVRSLLSEIKLNVTEGDVIRIRADLPRTLSNVSLHYNLYVPDGLKLRLQTGAGRIEVTNYKGDMQLTSNVGRIEVTASAGTLNANSGSGQITVRDHQGPVTARTNVGSLDLTNISGAMQLDSGTGSIHVREFRGGQLVAETRTGRIDATSQVPLEGNVSLKTSTGSVSLHVPRESSMRATAQTRTGGMSAPAFMNVTRSGTGSNAVGTTGDGKYTVSLEASTGSVNFSLR